jgi:hypothetical protein
MLALLRVYSVVHTLSSGFREFGLTRMFVSPWEMSGCDKIPLELAERLMPPCALSACLREPAPHSQRSLNLDRARTP